MTKVLGDIQLIHERASVENLTERGPNEQFFELCRINALAPEWYPSGFISFHIPTSTTQAQRWAKAPRPGRGDRTASSARPCGTA